MSELYRIARVPARIELFLSWFVRVLGQRETRKRERERERENQGTSIIRRENSAKNSGPFLR